PADAAVPPADAAVDPGRQPCDPPLGVSPGLAFARVYDLVTLRAEGGTGDWRFALVQDASGALLNPETGAYLAGEQTGVSDIVRVTDEGCLGEVRAEIRVVDALAVAPLAIELPPGGRFTFRAQGGSGRLDFALEQDASGAQIADDGLYVAGQRPGRDVVRVTDEGTGQVVIATVLVTPDAALLADPPQLFLPVGSSHPIEILGGSGEFDFQVEGDGVVVEAGRLQSVAPGRATIRARDRFLGTEVSFRATALRSFQAPLTRTGDASSWTFAHAPGDLDGDGFADALVGLSETDQTWADAGTVYLYRGGPDGLDPTPVHMWTGRSRHEAFGRAITTGDVDGDGRPDLLIGAHLADVGFTDTGVVRIYRGVEGGDFEDEPTWELSGPRGSDQIGISFAVCDFNGDDRLDLAVGAPLYEDRDLGPAGTNQGAILVYLGGPEGYPARADQELLGSLPDGQGGMAPAADLRIGGQVVAGDIDGDGLCDLAASTTQFNVGPGSADGLIQIFRGVPPDDLSAGGLTRLPVRVIVGDEDDSNGGNLGRRLAMGDVNGDGRADVIAGRHAHDVPGRANAGEVVVFLGGDLSSRPAGSTVSAAQADWRFVGDDANDNLGIGVAAGDVDGDGVDDVLAGGWFDEIPGEPASTGLVRVFFGVRGGLPADETDVFVRLPDPDNTRNRLFGEAVAVLGDVDGDGAADVFGAASREDTLGDDVGAFYWFPGTRSDEARSLELPGGIGGQRFGQAASVVGDVNGDGLPDAVVGAPFQGLRDNGRTGRAWLYLGEATGFSTEPALAFDEHPDHSGFDLMGWNAAPAGDFDGDGVDDFAIAARDEEPPSNLNNANLFRRDGDCPARQSNHGAIYIYRGQAGGLPSARPDWIYYGPEGNAQQSEIGTADVNGDGRADLIIGSHLWDGAPGGDSGGVEVVLGRPPSGDDRPVILCDPVFSMRGSHGSSHMGRSVIGLGDVDGDGCGEVAFGAGRENMDGLNTQGVVRVLFGFGGPGCPAEARVGVMAPGEASAEAGFALAAGDLDGDGVPDLVVGAPNHLVEGQRRGGVWVVPGTHVAGLQRRTPEASRADAEGFDPRGAAWRVEGRFPGERFGTSVGAAGSVILASTLIANYSGVPEVGGARLYQVGPTGVDRAAVGMLVGQTARPGGRLGDRAHGRAVGGRLAFIVGGYDAQGIEGDQVFDPGAAYGFYLDRP
ncbi:MAG: VCBS repeat-containing protein, partial [Myxococcales bacterium]|nr:VCBS repeat-containing protein [Myxococcales bacterium]